MLARPRASTPRTRACKLLLQQSTSDTPHPKEEESTQVVAPAWRLRPTYSEFVALLSAAATVIPVTVLVALAVNYIGLQNSKIDETKKAVETLAQMISDSNEKMSESNLKTQKGIEESNKWLVQSLQSLSQRIDNVVDRKN